MERTVGHVCGRTDEELALTSRHSLHMRPSGSASSTIFHFRLLRFSKKSCLISGFPHFPHPSPTHPSITDQYKSILSLAGSGLGSVQNQTSQTRTRARSGGSVRRCSEKVRPNRRSSHRGHRGELRGQPAELEPFGLGPVPQNCRLIRGWK